MTYVLACTSLIIDICHSICLCECFIGFVFGFVLSIVKKHYYMSHTTVNPKRIVAKGSDNDLDDPHDRVAKFGALTDPYYTFSSS